MFVQANLRKQCESTKNVLVPEVANLEATHPLKSFGVTLEMLANQTNGVVGKSAASTFVIDDPLGKLA